ncbi:MAG: FMN-binding negative transcriptional regulator [Lysobacterales bacterium]
MYTPRAFAETDLLELDHLVARDAFATVVSTSDDAPFASHLPLLYARDGQHVQFRGHWARPNPQWQGIEGQQIMLIVHGPHAYVSPSWYADGERQVPTWNYAVAHIYGRARVFEDSGSLAKLVAELATKYESAVESSWRFDPGAEHNRVDLRGIVGFSLDAERIELKFKFNQNHPAINVLGAANALESLGGEQGMEVAAQMRERLERRLAGHTGCKDNS